MSPLRASPCAEKLSPWQGSRNMLSPVDHSLAPCVAVDPIAKVGPLRAASQLFNPARQLVAAQDQ